MKRLFIAFDIDDELRAQLSQRAARLRQELDGLQEGVRWLPANRYHMTAVFLGDTDEGAIPGLREVLEAPELPVDIETRLGAPLVFPKPRDPRVLVCALTEHTEPLRELTDRIRRGLQEVGVSFDKKPFKPHITIGYLRKRPRQTQREIADTWLRQPVEGETGGRIAALSLYESVLNPSGPTHTRLFTRSMERGNA